VKTSKSAKPQIHHIKKIHHISKSAGKLSAKSTVRFTKIPSDHSLVSSSSIEFQSLVRQEQKKTYTPTFTLLHYIDFIFEKRSSSFSNKINCKTTINFHFNNMILKLYFHKKNNLPTSQFIIIIDWTNKMQLIGRVKQLQSTVPYDTTYDTTSGYNTMAFITDTSQPIYNLLHQKIHCTWSVSQ